MDKLGSDRARAETSKKVHDIMRTLFIGDWTSEPHFHHQNFAERMIKELKKFTNWVLNYSDAPRIYIKVIRFVVCPDHRSGSTEAHNKRKAAIQETENAIIGENRREHVALTRSAPD